MHTQSQRIQYAWGNADDTKLIKQAIYFAMHPNDYDNEFKFIIKHLKRRGIVTYTQETIQKHKFKAMQTHYTSDDVLYSRVFEMLYKAKECPVCGTMTFSEYTCHTCRVNIVAEDLKALIRIGLCQPKFYKPTVWYYAKELMEFAIYLNLVIECDLGKGKGKYASQFSVDTLAADLSKHMYATGLATAYRLYRQKIEQV